MRLATGCALGSHVQCTSSFWPLIRLHPRYFANNVLSALSYPYILDAHTAVAPSEDDPRLQVDRIAISRLNAGDDRAWALTEQAHFILVLTHGSVSCFRGLQRLISGMRMEQTLFVHNNMEDECTALMPQLRLSAADYLTIQRYVKCYDRANATQLHRFLAARFGGFDWDYAPAQYPRWHGLYGYSEEEEPQRLAEVVEARRAGRSIIGVIIPFYLLSIR